MLPGFGPRVTIGPNTGVSNRAGCGGSRPPASAEGRSRRARPPIAPGCRAATLAQPTRKSLDGIKPLESAGLHLFDDSSLQTVPPAVASSAQAEISAGISHSASAASLSSESDLALLLGTNSDSSHPDSNSTPLVFGSFPPVVVSVPPNHAAAESPAAADIASAACTSNELATAAEPAANSGSSDSEHETAEPSAAAASGTSKLKATSHEFYPQAYLAAAAAATAIAARSITSRLSSSSSSQSVNSADSAAADAQAAVSEETVSPSTSAAAGEEQEQAQKYMSYVPAVHPQEQLQHQEQNYYQQAAQQAADQQHYWQQHHHHPQQQQAYEQQHQYWQQGQQQHWQQWQEQQQQQGHPIPVPVFFPVLVQPYPYAHYPQQHPAHMAMVPTMLPADPNAAAAAAEGAVQHQHQQQQQQQQEYAPPAVPMSLPSDTCSLMSMAPTPTSVSAASAAAAPWQHSSLYGSSSSSRPASSAGSVISSFSSSTRQRQQREHAAARDAGTVTVSALSCVKDAAGALAKVVTRHGSCLLLSLTRPEDQVAQATHIAAKSLAVARFYVNAHMAAAGAAGIDAAAALTGVDSQAATPTASDAAAPMGVNDEVVFMPYQRSSSSRQQHDTADLPLGFLVAKANAKDLPVQLPPPVGIPACMQDKGQQQQHRAPAMPATAASSSGSSSSAAPLLKAGANTDVNKLSNAVIHNILGSGHVAMQLAGAAACHVAMRALIKAADRLRRKFNTDIVATASFANEDTSSSIGRSTVFLRLDVMRSNLLQRLTAAGAAVVEAMEQQQQQPALAAV